MAALDVHLTPEEVAGIAEAVPLGAAAGLRAILEGGMKGVPYIFQQPPIISAIPAKAGNPPVHGRGGRPVGPGLRRDDSPFYLPSTRSRVLIALSGPGDPSASAAARYS